MTSTTTTVAYPGAVPPERMRIVDTTGVPISVKEWGDPDAPPVMLAHGGLDFARTNDVFAPLIAAGGWRVVSWDQRGHGDSGHAALYSWDADIRDALAVINSVGAGARPMIGHSKGGALLFQLSELRPDLMSKMVNIDGMPSHRSRPDVADHDRVRQIAEESRNWLSHRHKPVGKRRPGTLDELAERRAVMNPRLDPDWLRYLVTVGAYESDDGWRWKLDPVLRFGGFGPWRPEWMMYRMNGIGIPLLGLLGMAEEPMGWGTKVEDLDGYLPPTGRIVPFDDAGHFIHIERPRQVADLVLEFLGSPA